MERVRFGEERNFKCFATSCPDCGNKRGELHKPGCSVEECPKCHDQVLHCHCLALDMVDAELLVNSIARQVDPTESFDLMEKTKRIDSYYLGGCRLQYISAIMAFGTDGQRKFLREGLQKKAEDNRG